MIHCFLHITVMVTVTTLAGRKRTFVSKGIIWILVLCRSKNLTCGECFLPFIDISLGLITFDLVSKMLHQQEWCWWYLFSKPTNDKRKCWKKQKTPFTGYLPVFYLPGAAAPGIDVPSWCTVLVCPFLQPIGLVDYESLKKFICRVRLFSSRFLKQFMEWASTSSCDNLFHLWPSEKRSTNVNRSDNPSSPISKCALWLKCLRHFWKMCSRSGRQSFHQFE